MCGSDADINTWLSHRFLVGEEPILGVSMEYVTIFMAWPYVNGPLHLGHVAGNCLPADIQYKYERARGRAVLMCSGSDEHGTPITVTAEELGVHPQTIVDEFHESNIQSLENLGCSWHNNLDSRGVEFGGALYNRTTDPRHKELVGELFIQLLESGLLEKKMMQQYCAVGDDGSVKFLPDRYVVGICPLCGEDGARGDQCDECGGTYEANELLSPQSKIESDSNIEVRDSEHYFYRLDMFQDDLSIHADSRRKIWKPNVRAMTKNWLDMGLRPRAVTRDMEWGIKLPNTGDDWDSKRIYVWFEAVQGYYTCARIWSERFASQAGHSMGDDAWKNWWIDSSESSLKHIYFMGKDNIPFHTIIWPAILMGLNSSGSDQLHLEDNVAANEFLMLQGGQFSKSRKHGIWLPAFLENHDPDSLRYYLTINMPEGHDTDFRWRDFVEKVNNELIGTYGNFVHRVMTLTHRLENGGSNPLKHFDEPDQHSDFFSSIDANIQAAMDSMERQRFKESLRSVMNIAQSGNSFLQKAEPWKYLDKPKSKERDASLSALAACWRACRTLAILTQPFMPFQAKRLWQMLGERGRIDETLWDSANSFDLALEWNPTLPSPLFSRLDLDEILVNEKSIAESNTEGDNKGIPDAAGGGKYIDFEDFLKVEMKTGRILSVENHPDADTLYVVQIEDGPNSKRTVCAGLKKFYDIEELIGMSIIFVANLKPRKLRGVVSEGMMLAAEDSEGNVRLLTADGDLPSGSIVR